MVRINDFWRRTVGLKSPPPEFVGYDNLIAFITREGLMQMEGDLIEIGAYMGGGTVKLARLAARHGKTVYVIDTFDPDMDTTVSKSAVPAAEVYRAFLKGRSMWEVYREATRRLPNIVTIIEDSREVVLDEEARFVFAFVDGCHQKSCVKSDFRLIWPHLVSGGIIGFHDYRYDDWPEVTEALDDLMHEHRYDIRDKHEIVGSYGISSMLLTKK
ncbi:MAG: class I SAM-dependent methyltransferase [Dehalococcoidia bacterium]